MKDETIAKLTILKPGSMDTDTLQDIIDWLSEQIEKLSEHSEEYTDTGWYTARYIRTTDGT